jgi:hypothetical protein
VKDEVNQLYMVEKWRLEDVRDLMKERHGFDAGLVYQHPGTRCICQPTNLVSPQAPCLENAA